MIDKMMIRGAKVHKLKNIDVDISLGKIVGISIRKIIGMGFCLVGLFFLNR